MTTRCSDPQFVPLSTHHPAFIEFIERWNDGSSIVKLAKHYNMTTEMVDRRLDFARAAGVKMRTGKPGKYRVKLIDDDPAQLGRLVRAWNAGVELCLLVERFGLGAQFIRDSLEDAEASGMYVRRSNYHFAALARPRPTCTSRPRKAIS